MSLTLPKLDATSRYLRSSNNVTRCRSFGHVPSTGLLVKPCEILNPLHNNLLPLGYNDYVDHTFQCPAKTTCPVVCVTDISKCPPSLACNNSTTLCLDGYCHSDCSFIDSYFDASTSLCPNACTPVMCPRTIQDLDTCFSLYGSYYNDSKVCAEQKVAADSTQFSLREAPFVVVYVLVTLFTFLMFAWCAFNQRISPVPGSTQPLHPDTATIYDISSSSSSTSTSNVPLSSSSSPTSWTQTGYKGITLLRNPLGTLLYVAILFTLVGLQVILAIMVLFYYIQQGAIFQHHTSIFKSDVQVLTIFEIAWGVAFALTFILKWPNSIRSIFYRRCLLQEATCVAIYTPHQEDINKRWNSSKDDSRVFPKLKRTRLFIHNFYRGFFSFMSFLFSDVHASRSKGQVTFCNVLVDREHHVRYFVFRLRRYVFHEDTSMFIPILIHVGDFVGDFLSLHAGLKMTEAQGRQFLLGPNALDLPKPSYLKNVQREFNKTFYTYQLFMIWAWCPLYSYFMACVQAAIITIGGLTVSLFLYRNETNTYRLTRIAGDIPIVRNGSIHMHSIRDVVPGDVVQVTMGRVAADMVLIEGHEIIVDESALTGESTPMVKRAIDLSDSHSRYNTIVHKRYTLSAGTTVIETSGNAKALVLKTGSYTMEGELLRETFSLQRFEFEFVNEVKMVFFILIAYALLGFTLIIYLYKDWFAYKWFYGMYVVATAIPPLLPTVFTISVGISNQRLASKSIACSDAERILVGGKVKVAFFDKTGTLTKQGMDFLSASVHVGKGNSEMYEKPSGYLKIGMATCHSLTYTSHGLLVGNHVDKNMFQAVNGTLEQNIKDNTIRITVDGVAYSVFKRFEFDHHTMTMSVIIQDDDGNLFALVKGSGESIRSICIASSIPLEFDKQLELCAKKGIYQISMAMKTLPQEFGLDTTLSLISRDDLERDLTFVGVINFKNILREETVDVIRQLREGDVTSVMVTGDSVWTGICIARECGIIKADETVVIGKGVKENGEMVWVDEDDQIVPAPTVSHLLKGHTVLAIAGNMWQRTIEESISAAMLMSDFYRVFGRCTPNDKADIIGAFIDRGIVCSMVGDGGNDCGALKVAQVGIALSDTEASVVAPFTALDKSITAILEVLREGRCALTSAFAAYKYMIMYGQIETLTQLVNAYFSISFSQWCWVFMDGFWMISMAFSLPLAKAHEKLSRRRPTSSILGSRTMCSVIGILAINFSCTVIALASLWNAPFFKCRRWDSTDISNSFTIGDNYESTVLFLVTGYQYISSAMAFNFGFNHRRPWIRNWIFVSLVIGYSAIHFTVTLYPSSLSCFWRINCDNRYITMASSVQEATINNPYHTTVMPIYFRWTLLGIMTGNAALIVSWEYFIVNKIGTWLRETLRQN